ncbi:4Fe-4S ferredoxin N-terminal domain-containing protein [Salinilacihabitans rarus]|uniref:4Fe-4S ferredoxin N-terminal domain-containing protein n=1 Tax=Salinilacihabitans rarus TaxID=2961596 RepID=UPI0020C858D2|nr:4Fe-4S ferredoxin N-terminal domain-containing protein [Salinilacihabitans rarus]
MDDVDDRMTDEEAVGVDADTWEDAADEILADGPYDSELGKRMSRDAVRVSIGRMSETEFHEKYHEDVLAEFGVDERPTGPGGADE